jgi:hypothetical protein
MFQAPPWRPDLYLEITTVQINGLFPDSGLHSVFGMQRAVKL